MTNHNQDDPYVKPEGTVGVGLVTVGSVQSGSTELQT